MTDNRLLWLVGVVAVCLFALSADIRMTVMTVQGLTNYLSHRVIHQPCGGIRANRSDKLTCNVILIAGAVFTLNRVALCLTDIGKRLNHRVVIVSQSCFLTVIVKAVFGNQLSNQITL